MNELVALRTDCKELNAVRVVELLQNIDFFTELSDSYELDETHSRWMCVSGCVSGRGRGWVAFSNPTYGDIGAIGLPFRVGKP